MNAFTVLVGNLCDDPREVRSGDSAAASIRIACSTGKDQAFFASVFFSGRDAETLLEHAKKGRLLNVTAVPKNSSYEKDGVTVNTVDFYGRSFNFLGSKGGTNNDEE